MKSVFLLFVTLALPIAAHAQFADKAGVITGIKGNEVIVKYEKVSVTFISGEHFRLLSKKVTLSWK